MILKRFLVKMRMLLFLCHMSLIESSRLRQQMEPGILTVLDMKREVSENDFSLLLSDEATGMQQWVKRQDLCHGDNTKSKDIVLDAFKARNGLKPNSETCCVSIKEKNQCVLINAEFANDKSSHLPPNTYKNAAGEDESSKIFVGVSGTWYACPEGFEPLIFKGPFGIENSCCGSEFKDGPSKEPKPCGASYCSTKLSLRETAYCDDLPPMETRRVASRHVDDILSGPTDSENLCAIESEFSSEEMSSSEDEEDAAPKPVEPSTPPPSEEAKREKTPAELYSDQCELKNTELMKENQESEDEAKKKLGGQCAVCVRVAASKVERECMECSRTRRASRNGWRCTSFAPDYPCGGSPEGVNQRSFEKFTDFAQHDTRAPMNEAELLTDFNDGRYRQGGAPDTTSPIRHHRRGHSMNVPGMDTPSGVRFEASGSCPELTRLSLEQGKDEPLHASSEDYSSDSERLRQVLQNLGTTTGLGDVRSVLFPRVSASATLSDPFEMPFASGGSHHFSCSDSRATDPILGTPGGDLGEFVLAMNVMERARRKNTEPFSDEMILYVVLEREARENFNHFNFSCFNYVAEIRRTSLAHTTGKSSILCSKMTRSYRWKINARAQTRL